MSRDPETAALMGVDTDRVAGTAFAAAAALAGSTGAVFAAVHYLHPSVGVDLTLLAVSLAILASTAQALVDGLFPALADRRGAAVRELSAGEQQMVALGRALMASPGCLVLDDPFLGLAPRLRARLAPVLRELASGQGLAILAAGQHVRTLLRVAHRAYLLDAGRVLVAGSGPELPDDPEVRRTLLDLGREASA